MRVRATAMLMLGDKESARHQTRALLRLDPEDARSQALLGRLDMLHGANREGRERIREALRIDPELFGRLPGVAEELKARSLFYKVVLRCLSLMIRARACAVLGVTAGRTPTRLAIVVAAAVLLVSVNAIGEWVRFSPDVPPIVKWSTALVVASVILTWNARPIYLTTIGVTRLGRTAIPRDLLVWSSTAVALILSATVLLAHYVLTGNKTAGAIALISWIAVYPLAAVHKCQRGWPRWGLLSVSFGTAIGGSVLVGHEAAAVPVGQVTNVIVVLLIGSRLAVWWLKRT